MQQPHLCARLADLGSCKRARSSSRGAAPASAALASAEASPQRMRCHGAKLGAPAEASAAEPGNARTSATSAALRAASWASAAWRDGRVRDPSPPSPTAARPEVERGAVKAWMGLGHSRRIPMCARNSTRCGLASRDMPRPEPPSPRKRHQSEADANDNEKLLNYYGTSGWHF